jgi:hypothetical protein
MHGVKAFRVFLGQMDALHGTDLESRLFDTLKDGTREMPFDSIRLDDGQRSLVPRRSSGRP